MLAAGEEKIVFRSYLPVDRTACLAIFDSNAERYFSPGDREQFLAFLKSPPGFFGVLCDNADLVVGCGGIGIRPEGSTSPHARICVAKSTEAVSGLASAIPGRVWEAPVLARLKTPAPDSVLCSGQVVTTRPLFFP
jgi:hypothetical protein